MPRSFHAVTSELARITKDFEIPRTFTVEEGEKHVREIALIYDLTDELMKSTQHTEDRRRREEHVRIAIPFVTQIRCSTDVILTLYNETAFNGRLVTRSLQDTFEAAFRNAFYALGEFVDRMEALVPPGKVDPQATTTLEVVSLEFPDLD